MQVEVREVRNGWMVLPGYLHVRDTPIMNENVHVFNSFVELVQYLRSQSKLLAKDSKEGGGCPDHNDPKCRQAECCPSNQV